MIISAAEKSSSRLKNEWLKTSNSIALARSGIASRSSSSAAVVRSCSAYVRSRSNWSSAVAATRSTCRRSAGRRLGERSTSAARFTGGSPGSEAKSSAGQSRPITG